MSIFLTFLNAPLRSLGLALMLVSCPALADVANNVMRYSESELLAAAKLAAEGVSRASPAQIDNYTQLLGAIFVPDTKTFIYRYRTSGPIDQANLLPLVTQQTCSDRIRQAFLRRGITIQHVYITPRGQHTLSITQRNC